MPAIPALRRLRRDHHALEPYGYHENSRPAGIQEMSIFFIFKKIFLETGFMQQSLELALKTGLASNSEIHLTVPLSAGIKSMHRQARWRLYLKGTNKGKGEGLVVKSTRFFRTEIQIPPLRSRGSPPSVIPVSADPGHKQHPFLALKGTACRQAYNKHTYKQASSDWL